MSGVKMSGVNMSSVNMSGYLMKGGSMVSALLGVIAPYLISSIVPGIAKSIVNRKLK